MTAVPSAEGRKPGFFLLAFLVFAAAVFVALGIWQVERLQWKLDLIARVDARVHAAPTSPPTDQQWYAGQPQDFEYRHVTAHGSFDHARETYVQAVTELGPGYWVMTPLDRADGPTILVNRGFVPSEKRDPAARAEGQVNGEVSVTGLLRLSEPKGGFLRSNDPAAGRWYSRDVSAIAQDKKLGDSEPYFIDADATPNPGGYPVGGLTVIRFPNSHLSYAITWFAMALLSLGTAGYCWRLRRAAR
jgi:surfeit locus 1 family protein